MIRYLTPSKIGLLVLIALYTEAMVPDDAIIPILTFITSRLIPQSVSVTDTSNDSTSPSLLISDFEKVTRGFETTIPGRTLHDAFLRRIWAISSLHALHNFFRNLSRILTKPRPQLLLEPPPDDKILISRVSPLGVFVRRAQLEFVRLQFDDSVKLWISFIKFREASEPLWRKKRPSIGVFGLDSNLADLDLGPDSDLLHVVYPTFNHGREYEPELSTEEMEKLLDFQLEKLQRTSCSLTVTDRKQS